MTTPLNESEVAEPYCAVPSIDPLSITNIGACATRSDPKVLALRQELDRYREALERLSEAVADFIIGMDKTMVGPSTHERGVVIARLVGALQDAWDEVRTALSNKD